MYKALIEIGGFKKGEIVPDEQAEIWLQMYRDPCVEKIADELPQKKVPEIKEEKKSKLSLFKKSKRRGG